MGGQLHKRVERSAPQARISKGEKPLVSLAFAPVEHSPALRKKLCRVPFTQMSVSYHGCPSSHTMRVMAWCPLPVWSCAALATAIKNEGWLPLGGRIVRAVGQRVTGPLTLGFEMCRVRALAYFRRKSSDPRNRVECEFKLLPPPVGGGK